MTETSNTSTPVAVEREVTLTIDRNRTVTMPEPDAVKEPQTCMGKLITTSTAEPVSPAVATPTSPMPVSTAAVPSQPVMAVAVLATIPQVPGRRGPGKHHQRRGHRRHSRQGQHQFAYERGLSLRGRFRQ